MRFRVFVALKPTVLDPQGQTICSALNGMGHRAITEVRQGKYFDITLEGSLSGEEAARQIQQIAQDVLANPVIEDYRVEPLD